MAQTVSDAIEAAHRRIALVEDMLAETNRSQAYLGRSRDLSRLRAELLAQKKKLRALEKASPVLI